MNMRIFSLLILPLILSGLFVRPAQAGDEAKTISLYSDRKGDAGWIELDRADGRTQATPYLRVSGETVGEAMNQADRNGEARVSAMMDTGKPDPAGAIDRETRKKKTLSSLLEGPNGVSLGAVLDLARQASESAKIAIRQVRAGNAPPQLREAAR